MSNLISKHIVNPEIRQVLLLKKKNIFFFTKQQKIEAKQTSISCFFCELKISQVLSAMASLSTHPNV